MKNISDEIIKINDFCVEFHSKLSVLKKEIAIDEKNVAELNSLKLKIESHSIFLIGVINNFPFGSPITYIFKDFFDFYKKEKKELDRLLFCYLKFINFDTCLERTSEIFNEDRIIVEYPNNIDKNRALSIIDSGQELCEYLSEKVDRKFVRLK